MTNNPPRIELEIQGRPDRGELVPLRAFARAVESLTDLLAQVNADRPRPVDVGFYVSDGVGGIVVRGFGQEVPITTTGAERAKAVLNRRFHSYGSVEGTIETVSIHEPRPYFNVFHALDGHAIKCRCDTDLLAQAKAAMGSRVRVVGEIERRFDGRAETMDATELRVLRSRDELPQVAQIRGLFADEVQRHPDEAQGAHG